MIGLVQFASTTALLGWCVIAVCVPVLSPVAASAVWGWWLLREGNGWGE